MADVKNYGLRGTGSDVQLGKSGPRIKVNGGLVQFRNPADAAYVNVEVLDPTADQHAATKGYVDAVATGLDIKDSVRAATTGSVTLATDLENGDTLDGVVLATGDRILVKNQGNATNGIYVVAASGSPTRSSDADEDAEVTSGMFTFVEEGTVNAGKGFVLTTANPITVGVTTLTFTQFSDSGAQDPLYRQEVFTFSDSGTNPFSVALPTNAIVQRVKVKVTTAWDATETIIIDDAGGQTYMASTENDPEEATTFVADMLGSTAIGANALQAKITAANTPTQGSATVHVEYVLS